MLEESLICLILTLRYFLDHDPEIFEYVLQYFRYQKIFGVEELSVRTKEKIRAQAEMFEIRNLQSKSI